MGVESKIERIRLPKGEAPPFSLEALNALEHPGASLAQSDSLEQHADFEHELERERHYFLPRTVLENLVPLEQLRSTFISQSYFPKTFAKGAWAMVAMTHSDVALDGTAEITQARLRSSISSEGVTSYEFTLKYKETDAGPSERQELTISLTQEMYNELLPFATNGTVEKKRYFLEVPVGVLSGFSLGTNSAGLRGSVTLEIDLPLSCETDGNTYSLRPFDVALIDVECPSEALMDALRDGEHDVALLHSCIDISSDCASTHHLRKPLSWKEIAKSGFKKKAQKSVQALADLHRRRVAA